MKYKEKTNEFNHIKIITFYQQKILFKLLKDNPQTKKIFATIQGIIIQKRWQKKTPQNKKNTDNATERKKQTKEYEDTSHRRKNQMTNKQELNSVVIREIVK